MSTTITQNNKKVDITLDKPIITVTDNNKGTTVNVEQVGTPTIVVAAAGLKGDPGTNTGVSQATDIIMPFADITASGEISASGELTSHLLRFTEGADNYIRHTEDKGVNIKSSNYKIYLAGNTTASGDISASGKVYSNQYYTDNYSSLNTVGTKGRVFSDSSITGIQIGREGSSDRNIELLGPVTASGDISASGNLIVGGGITFDGDETLSTIGASDDLSVNPKAALNLGSAETDVIKIGRQSGTAGAGRTEIYANTSTVAAKFSGSQIIFNHPVTASGDISSSGNIKAKDAALRTITMTGTSVFHAGYSIQAGNVSANLSNYSMQNLNLGYSNTTGNITASGHISASSFVSASNINITSNNASSFPSSSNVRTTAAFTSGGTLTQDSLVIVKKVTGAQAKAMTTTDENTFITLIPAPGANKVIVVRELELFIDRGSWNPYVGPTVKGYGGALLAVIETPVKTNGGVGSTAFNYNTFATIQKKVLNHTYNGAFTVANAVDTLLVRDAPVTQTRAYPNVPLLLKPENALTTQQLADSSQTPDDNYYFRITYKILDLSTDFAVT